MIPTSTQRSIETDLDTINEKVDDIRGLIDNFEWDEDADIDDAAADALLLLQAANGVVRELREAGASIVAPPIEDEALVNCIANADLVHRAIREDVAHLEDVVQRLAS